MHGEIDYDLTERKLYIMSLEDPIGSGSGDDTALNVLPCVAHDKDYRYLRELHAFEIKEWIPPASFQALQCWT